MGKSGSGKDSIGRRLLERLPSLRRIIPYTTRPMRSGEKEGVEYHFVTPEELAAYEAAGEVIEKRSYPTVYGEWIYFTRIEPQVKGAFSVFEKETNEPTNEGNPLSNRNEELSAISQDGTSESPNERSPLSDKNEELSSVSQDGTGEPMNEGNPLSNRNEEPSFVSQGGTSALRDKANLGESYLAIGTLEAYQSFKSCFGRENLLPVLIELEDGERLMRALKREREQAKPGYAELCRRFLADSKDFSEENIRKAEIPAEARFQNTDIDSCLEEVVHYILKRPRE